MTLSKHLTDNAYGLVEDYITINYAKGRAKKINAIVFHSMEGFYNGTISWFKNPDAKVSAHFLVAKSGEVRQMVRLEDCAWHAGAYNDRSIGIELEDEMKGANYVYTVAQIVAVRELVKWLRQTYGDLQLLLHKDLSAKRHDPVGNFSLDWFINSTSSNISNNSTMDYKAKFEETERKLNEVTTERDRLNREIEFKDDQLDNKELLNVQYRKELNDFRDNYMKKEEHEATVKELAEKLLQCQSVEPKYNGLVEALAKVWKKLLEVLSDVKKQKESL